MDIDKAQVQERIAKNKEKICKYIEQGLWFKEACIASGITERTGHRWKNEDVSFVSQVEAANAKYHEKLVRSVNEHATRDGRLALKILQIRYPEVWNPKRKIQIVNPEEELKRIEELIYGKQNINR